MVIEDGKYKELTEKELREIYFSKGWDEVFSIIDFRKNFEASGCKIVNDSDSTEGK